MSFEWMLSDPSLCSGGQGLLLAGDDVTQDFVDGSEDDSQNDFGLFFHNSSIFKVITLFLSTALRIRSAKGMKACLK